MDTFIDSDLGEFCISKGIVTNRRSLRRYPLITHQKSNFFSRKVKGPLVIPSAKKPKEEQGDEFKPKRPISVFRHAENHLKFEDLDKEAFEHYVKTFGKPNGDTFGKCLKVYLKRDGITQAKLAEAVNVSDNTISRICTDRYIPPLQLAVAICIALHLYPYESDYMLDLAGHSLNGASPEIAVYKLILNIFYLKEVEECNAFLEEYGLKTLTKSVVEIRK